MWSESLKVLNPYEALREEARRKVETEIIEEKHRKSKHGGMKAIVMQITNLFHKKSQTQKR